MNNLAKTAIFIILVFTANTARSQVVISLLFGEKLNSDKIEFGLIGGFNWSELYDLEEASALTNFNLGFYFHFKVAENSFLSTGVLVKSDLGTTGMETYQIGEPDFDSVFVDGKLTKRIAYFHVPILYQYRFKDRFYLEGGIQAGLRTSAQDIFTKSEFGGDLEYIRNTRSEYTVLDAGLLGGFGIKFKQQPKSMSMGLRYYYGLVNVSTIENTTLKNSSIYLFIKIPIGVKGDPDKEP